MIAELIFEAQRIKKAADICRREGMSPALFARWRSKFKEAGIAAMRDTKRGPKAKNPELDAENRENQRLKTALCEASIELLLLKKSVSSGYMAT